MDQVGPSRQPGEDELGRPMPFFLVLISTFLMLVALRLLGLRDLEALETGDDY